MTKKDVLPRGIDHQQAEAALRLTQYAVDHCKTAIAWIRSDGRLFYTNEAERQQLGYSQQELKSMSVSDVDPDWPADCWLTGWQRLKAAGVMTFESRHRCKNGNIFPVEVTTNYIEHDGEEYLFAFVTDITDRKRTEVALRDSETKLRAIFDHHYQLTGLLDWEGKLLAGNKTALDFAGADETEVIGRYFWDTPWWDRSQEPTIRNAIQRAARGEFVRFESAHIRADGEIRDFDFSLSPVRDDKNNVIYLVPEGRDITELKQAEKQLREHDAMIRGLVETSRDWIWAIDLLGVITYCNPAVEAILGYWPDELVGTHSLDLIHEEDRKMSHMELPQLTGGRHGWNRLVLRWRHKNGSWRFLESNAVPIVGAAGELMGFRGVDRDITDRLEAEEKLACMEARMAHVARLSAMGEMMAGITHEVVQPLYAISNFAHATANVLGAEAQPSLSDLREWNAAIVSSVERAEEIVKRMRAFARRGECERAASRVNVIVRESVQLVAFEARSCGVEVHLELPEPSPCVHVDRVQIQQVVVNLLRNAFEAMGESERGVASDVTIRVEPSVDSICVSVADTGPGFSAEGKADIFDPFATTKKNGLGLGLAISSSIIEAHDGELWAESAKTGGAVFHFTLPVLQGVFRDGV